MNAIIEWIKRWLGPVPPAVTDEHCPYCLGLGYDSSGFTCSCLREKKWRRLCELVRADEREACAGLCDRFANRMMSAEECAAAIRARSNT